MHKSNINIDEKIVNTFKTSQKSDLLFMKVIVKDESLILDTTGKNTGDPTKNWLTVSKTFKNKEGCYCIFAEGEKWILICYVPPDCLVKHKMLLASSRSCLKNALGTSYFLSDFFISDKEECSLLAYKEYLDKGNTDELLTMEEKWQHEALLNTPSQASTAMATLPIQTSDNVIKAIETIKNGNTNTFSMFSVERKTQKVSSEEINFSNVSDIASKLVSGAPCYILFNFKHKKPSGESVVVPIFIYYCPENAKVPDRMIYSTCKRTFVETCDSAGLTLNKKLEISEKSHVTVQFLMDELYPKQEVKTTFSKPTRPGRGKARMN